MYLDGSAPAVCGHQTGGDPDHLVAGQQQAVGQAAGEAAAVFDGPGDGGAVGDRADPLEQAADQVRVVLYGQSPITPEQVIDGGVAELEASLTWGTVSSSSAHSALTGIRQAHAGPSAGIFC